MKKNHKKRNLGNLMNLVKIMVLTSLLFGTAKLGAQVTIGADVAPHSFSVLELVAQYKSGVVGGLRLPQMTTDERNSLTGLSDPEAFGLMIYNTDYNCVEFWNSIKWVSFCEGDPPVPPEEDESGDYRINGNKCIDVVMLDMEAPCMDKVVRGSFTLTDPATQSFDYIFKNPTGEPYDNLTFSVIDSSNLVATKTFDGIDKFTITFVSNARNLAEGLDKDHALKVKIIATFTNNNGDKVYVPLEISIQDCSCGCTVNTVDGGTLTFMCWNLGAEDIVKTMTPAQQAAYTTPDDNYGWLFQWGRKDDGHQTRSPNPCLTTDVATTAPPGHSCFIYNMPSPFNWLNTNNTTLWNTSGSDANPVKNTTNDPCPDGWRVPTQSEWGSIFRGGTNGGSPTNATANDWHWNGTGTRGFLIKPKSATGYTLFLPAAGRINNSLLLEYDGSMGYYWSSSTITTNGYNLNFPSSTVSPGGNSNRVVGYSVRCVADE